MTYPKTSAAVLDGFLRCRARTLSERTHARDAEVVAWLRQFMSTLDLEPIDDLSAFVLARDRRREPTDHMREAAYEIVDLLPTFFDHWLAPGRGATPAQRALAAISVRALGRYLLQRSLIDDSIEIDLAALTRLYERGGTSGALRMSAASP